MCMGVLSESTYVCNMCAVTTEARRGHLSLWDWSYSWLWANIWVLSAELWCSPRAASALNLLATFPAHELCYFWNDSLPLYDISRPITPCKKEIIHDTQSWSHAQSPFIWTLWGKSRLLGFTLQRSSWVAKLLFPVFVCKTLVPVEWEERKKRRKGGQEGGRKKKRRWELSSSFFPFLFFFLFLFFFFFFRQVLL